MFQFLIGIIPYCLRMELGSALDCAAEMGAQGVQLCVGGHELVPAALDAEKR